MMPKLLQINITANWGSHGKIAEGIGKLAISQGWDSYIAYGRYANASASQLYHIGNMPDEYVHVAATRLLDRHGLGSKKATRQLVEYIRQLSPDIIHLHNIHGYYLNYPILFHYLEEAGIPVVWTLHDCWSFTGHCAHYMTEACDRWKTECHQCPLSHEYPKSWFYDRSLQNFKQKRQAFLSVKNMTIVPVSKWLEKEVSQSFLKGFTIRQIYNGIDISKFCPREDESIKDKYHIPPHHKIVLGVASKWYRNKGLYDFFTLKEELPENYSIVLVGLNKKQMNSLPNGIIGIERTNDIRELAALYSAANVFFNPTWEDNFPTTNIEAMACGTPVVTYNTGGCAECITDSNGFVVDQGDISSACKYIQQISNNPGNNYQTACRNHAESRYDEQNCFKEYLNLYYSLIAK